MTVSTKIPGKFAAVIKEDIDIIVNLNFPQIVEISLFGSCSRGECRYNSDVDLLIVTRGDKLSRYNTGFIRGEVEYVDKSMVSTDVVFYDEDVLNNSTLRIAANIRRDKIILWKEGKYTDAYKELL
jgi:predicted nucleotidyltransferase